MVFLAENKLLSTRGMARNPRVNATGFSGVQVHICTPQKPVLSLSGQHPSFGQSHKVTVPIWLSSKLRMASEDVGVSEGSISATAQSAV